MAIVSFKPQGRAGNFIFSLFNCIAYALKHSIEFSVPSKTSHDYWHPVYFQHLVNSKWNENEPTIKIFEKKDHVFEEIEYKKDWSGLQVQFIGYWQNPDYFKNYRKEILEYLNLPWNPINDTVSIHVRRTDFLEYAWKHQEIKKEWIEQAMTYFPNKRFLFHSDDIKWCKENFGNRKDVDFSEGKNELEDLISISNCEHHINSSSTFAWVGAYLNRNENRIVVTPKDWYVPGFCDTGNNLILENWIRL